MSTYVVGDLQGCLEPLKCLLEAVKFKRGRDVLWSVGDVVNRGPDSLATLRYLYRMRDDLVLVLGNHDLHLLAVAAGVRNASSTDTLDEILAAPDREELLRWLLRQPLLHREHGYTMVHAGIPPQWSVKKAARYAREVEVVLQSEQCVEFLRSMYGNEPAVWSDDLRGMERLRVITNYLTRMRYCTSEGWLDLESKGPEPPANGKRVSAWFSHPNRQWAGKRIIFGHWAALQGRTDNADVIGLDTGCVWGGSLSMFELDTGARTHCDCRDGLPVG